jgi:hypothetical protein
MKYFQVTDYGKVYFYDNLNAANIRKTFDFANGYKSCVYADTPKNREKAKQWIKQFGFLTLYFD